MNKKIRIGLYLVIFLFMGCAKEDTGIPSVRVELQVLMSSPQYSSLMGPGGYAFVDGSGVAGVVIYNTGYGYKAYDRCSTVNPEQANGVVWDPDSFNLRDPVSGALFDPATGMPTKAPGEKMLRQYYVTLLGPTVLRVTN